MSKEKINSTNKKVTTAIWIVSIISGIILVFTIHGYYNVSNSLEEFNFNYLSNILFSSLNKLLTLITIFIFYKAYLMQKQQVLNGEEILDINKRDYDERLKIAHQERFEKRFFDLMTHHVSIVDRFSANYKKDKELGYKKIEAEGATCFYFFYKALKEKTDSHLDIDNVLQKIC
ncbi:hypothetical protein QQ008_28925 [Fulvivirgaceae bacterium BMA10]|uniref:Uncharacterized protein n=1 Tax=Splendidivirga corallicola TaxID=3051826 RepID=A0ABT8L0V1_9BACT|nr:hypothetical protein [Fulvivirgaceae bacterium BMA10]